MLFTAYYFRQHMYTLVPRHVREDMRWMADVGTKVVAIAVLEQDLYAARENIDILCREAQRAGMTVHAVPSRWGGIVAGAPKVPSFFTASHPETWVLNREGRPHMSGVTGPISSVHHPATVELFVTNVQTLLRQFPITGIIWDEPKLLGIEDHSPMARKAMPEDAGPQWHIDALARFFDVVGVSARQASPDAALSLFMYAHLTGYAVDRLAAIRSLDYFGCDGRPWAAADGGTLEGAGKTLLDQTPRFLDAARKHGKKGLILIENHAMPLADYDLLDRRMPEVLALGAQSVLYYYYPRNLEDPDRLMAIIARHVRKATGR